MFKKTICMVAALALVGVASIATASDHWAEDRELNYVGSWSPVYYTCDHTDGHLGTGFHAIGGGVFCGVLTGTTVTVAVEDAVFDEPVVMFSCAWEREETPIPPEETGLDPVITLIVTSTEQLAETEDGTATFEVPKECLGSTSGDAPDDSTDIGVFPQSIDVAGEASVTCCSYTTGTVSLKYV